MTEPTPPIRVVLVDDDEEIIESVQLLLRGHPSIQIVGNGRNGREAIQLANKLRPDVMLLDVNMPVLNGLEAAARIASAFPAVAIVILTAEPDPDLVREALRTGVKDYLSKSTELSRVPSVIVSAEARRDRSAPTKGMASVWTFYSPKGCSGTTTMALNVACDLACLDYRVLLMDFDSLHGDCGFYLDRKPGTPETNLFSQLEKLESFEAATLDGFKRKHSLGNGCSLDLLESPGTFVAMEEKAEENLATVLELLVTAYDYIVIDVPPGRMFDRSTVLTLDFSERLFVLSNRDLSSLKALVQFTNILDQTAFSPEKLTLLFSPILEEPGFDLNAYVEKRLSTIKDTAEVPLDRIACSTSARRGVPVVLEYRDAPISRFVHAQVDRALNRPPAPAIQPTLWQNFKRLVGLDTAPARRA